MNSNHWMEESGCHKNEDRAFILCSRFAVKKQFCDSGSVDFILFTKVLFFHQTGKILHQVGDMEQ